MMCRASITPMMALLLATAILHGKTFAQDKPDTWLSKRVVARPGAVLMINGRLVKPEKPEDGSRIYRVEQFNGPWLWIKAEDNQAAGWVTSDWLMPHAQANGGQTVSAPDTPSPYLNRGLLWLEQKEYDRAIADFTEAIRLDPKNSPARRNRAFAWHSQKEYVKAIADYSEVIRLDPSDAWSRGNRGDALRERKDYDRAIADYTEAIRLQPGNARAYVSRGIAWQNKGDPYRAMADFDEAIKVDPKYAPAHHNLGLALMCQGLLDVADPELITHGLFDKAGAEFKETVRLDPNDLEARYYAGVCHWLGLRDDEAISGTKDFLEQGGWKGDQAAYAAIIGHFAAIRSGKPEEARRFLDEFHSKGDKTARLSPLVRFLRKEIDEKALMATSTDDHTLDIFHSCLAIDGLLKNKFDDAKPHFIWSKQHGAGCFEFQISSVWLERMENPDDNDARAE